MPLTAPGLMRLQPLDAVPVLLAAAGLWLAWPWLAPLWFPVPAAPDRPDLLVVLDGTPSQGRLKVRHKAAGAAMLVPVLSGLLPSLGRPRCQC